MHPMQNLRTPWDRCQVRSFYECWEMMNTNSIPRSLRWALTSRRKGPRLAPIVQTFSRDPVPILFKDPRKVSGAKRMCELQTTLGQITHPSLLKVGLLRIIVNVNTHYTTLNVECKLKDIIQFQSRRLLPNEDQPTVAQFHLAKEWSPNILLPSLKEEVTRQIVFEDQIEDVIQCISSRMI